MNKKIILVLVSFAFMITSCTKKAAPSASVEKKSAKKETNSNQSQGKDGMIISGENLYNANCGKCHELHRPEEFTASEWPSIIHSMAPKAKLNQSMKELVMAYVTANAKKG